ncbi:hypothetical protein KR018_003436 [Drosophila ironensis]|nr:hypothetical protein KR018_003436 [Drosophila ironensis]
MSRPRPASVVQMSLLLLVVLLGGLLQHHQTEGRFAPSLPVIPDICKQPPPRSEGIGTIEFEGYYYEPAILDCQKYSIGARHLKPGQSFSSLQDCVSTCVHGYGRNKDRYDNE